MNLPSSLKALHDLFPPRESNNGKIRIGPFTYGIPEIKTWGEESILAIGKYVSIADQVTIFLGGEHRTDWTTTYPFNIFLPEQTHNKGHPWSKGDVTIGNDVWIASGVTILSGVSVGDGAVIGANATVSKDVPPYAIVGGNPAKIIRYRFDEETVSRLLGIRWWDWEIEKIERAVPLLISNDISAFLRFCRE